MCVWSLSQNRPHSRRSERYTPCSDSGHPAGDVLPGRSPGIPQTIACCPAVLPVRPPHPSSPRGRCPSMPPGNPALLHGVTAGGGVAVRSLCRSRPLLLNGERCRGRFLSRLLQGEEDGSLDHGACHVRSWGNCPPSRLRGVRKRGPRPTRAGGYFSVNCMGLHNAAMRQIPSVQQKNALWGLFSQEYMVIVTHT